MTSKAVHYIDQLDNARCTGDWKAVPELVRKIRKHAPERSCLTLTAETEFAISEATSPAHAATSKGRPDSAPTTTKNLDVSGQVPQLLNARDAEAHFPEDKLQAQVCMGWMQWVIGEYTAASASLPKTFDQQTTGVDPTQTASEWTAVSILKGGYLKANCLTREDRRKEALITLHSALPALARIWAGMGVRQQMHYWAELFLTEYCTQAAEALLRNETSLDDTNSLACFRSWARYWETVKTPAGGHGFKGSTPRRKVWCDYYLALTRIVEKDLALPAGYTSSVPNEASGRSRLRAELNSVESLYKALLLAETTFPRADETRIEVETFIKAVMQNWTILCGRGWQEQDLGPGGRNSYSRNILDTLYSAATRTYHSTTILRSLFLVHLSVAEFDVAFKAFDSYLELIKKGKARVEKTGHLEASLDDDAVVLETMSQSIIGLCRYGHKSAAEKARHLGAELEDWLSKLPQLKASDAVTPAIPENNDEAAHQQLHPPIPPHVVALAWQAIGLAHGHWSRVTHEHASRTEIQAKAIRCLKRSLAPEFGRSKDIRSFFALALLLAERRELTPAIEYVTRALKTSSGQEESYDLTYGQYWQERSLILMWHLLALLLSARQDYITAARACEGALEQFKDPTVLFGKSSPGFKSEHLNEAEPQTEPETAPGGLVDDMDDAEKESILEVKITQLTLLEMTEGADVAVNASYELLTLFSRLYGYVAAQPTFNAPQQIKEPPKTSGTLRSIKGSIFGGRSRPPTRQPSTVPMNERSSLVAQAPRPMTAQTTASTAPTIQVTGEAGRSSSVSAARSQSRRRNSLKRRERSNSRHRAAATGLSAQTSAIDETPYFTPAAEAEQLEFFNFSGKRSSSRSSSYTRGRSMPPLASHPSSASKASDYSELLPENVVLASSVDLLPLVQYSKEKEKMHRATVLIRVWLVIAGLYRRADMIEDGKGAVAEAHKLVQALETESGRETANAGAGKGPQWAERKSVDDLWGDVLGEFGQLHVVDGEPYKAREYFEAALTQSPDHPTATIGLSSILLDIYSEDLLPPPTVPPLVEADTIHQKSHNGAGKSDNPVAASFPLGLKPSSFAGTFPPAAVDNRTTSPLLESQLPAPYKATSLPLADRLAARDRAYALLSGLTRLGEGWNLGEAWFTLARAYEESGQVDKAKDVLWWCVELEEATGVRPWTCLGNGGYTL